MEIIPAIDLRGGRCVRLRQGDYARETIFHDDPVSVAKQWESEGATRIHLVDLDAARSGQPENLETVRQITQAVSIPCQLGGGIRTQEILESVLNDHGLDRAIIGTQALKQPAWFREMVSLFPDRVALGLDAKDSMVATAGWLEVSHTSALDLAQQFQGEPLAAVIYTNISNDGMMQGIDAATFDDFRRFMELGFPVIASGGVTTLDDVKNLMALYQESDGLIGAIVGRALYEKTIELPQAIALTKESA